MNVRMLREKKGITQAELSRRANLPQGTLSVYESTCRIINNPTPEYMARIAKVLDVTVEQLLAMDERLIGKDTNLKRKRCLNEVCLLNKRKRCVNPVVLSNKAPCFGSDRVSEKRRTIPFNGEVAHIESK